MVTATVLIKAEARCIPGPAEKIAEMPGVAEEFAVAGRGDRVAIVRVTRNEEPADVISARMRLLEGAVETDTMIALRAYSRRQPGAGFELGRD